MNGFIHYQHRPIHTVYSVLQDSACDGMYECRLITYIVKHLLMAMEFQNLSLVAVTGLIFNTKLFEKL